MIRETGVQSQVESYQKHYKVRIKGKVELSRERSSAPLDTFVL